MGADVCLYSATKYLGGMSDLIAGVAIVKDAEILRKIRSKRSLFGNILQPDECWILDSRLPTVELRMSRQSKNAARIVPQLAQHPKVQAVYYPDLFQDAEQCRIREHPKIHAQTGNCKKHRAEKCKNESPELSFDVLRQNWRLAD